MAGYKNADWMKHMSTRVDEFQRQANLHSLPGGAPPQEGPRAEERTAGARQVGTGLEFSEATTTDDLISEQHRLRWSSALPASFALHRHVAYCLGRPFLVHGIVTDLR